ncbi:MAG: cell division ATP-binding protein FtsE [Candidatus Moranbacteria bacterium]|nr:cell division ATP-binding protein FtsE [Candidatus Moranbacteria bacterium]
MLKFNKVNKVYSEDFLALRDINLEIMPGEFVSIVGRSGAGKSSLLKLIYAEEKPTTGELYFNGEDVSLIKRKNLPYFRRNIGNVFQDFKLLPHKTVFENVSYALEVAGKSNEEIEEEIPEVLTLVNLSSKADKYPNQLSGGEQQRVSIARALVHNPVLIVADEPTGNLDPSSSIEIVELLLRINELGTTIILATHDRDIVNKVAKRVITLDGGKIVSDKTNGKYLI